MLLRLPYRRQSPFRSGTAGGTTSTSMSTRTTRSGGNAGRGETRFVFGGAGGASPAERRCAVSSQGTMPNTSRLRIDATETLAPISRLSSASADVDDGTHLRSPARNRGRTRIPAKVLPLRAFEDDARKHHRPARDDVPGHYGLILVAFITTHAVTIPDLSGVSIATARRRLDVATAETDVDVVSTG